MESEGSKSYIFTLLHGGREEQRPAPEAHFDPARFASISGVLKSIQVIFNLLIFVIISLSRHSNLGRLSFLSLTAGIGFFTSGVLLGCHVMHIAEKYKAVPLLKIEIGYAAMWTLLLAIGSTVCLLYIGYGTVFGIIPFFGFIDTVIYAYDVYSNYKIIKSADAK